MSERDTKYTIQVIVAGYSQPDGTDVQHVDTLEQARTLLLSEHRNAERFGAAYEPSEALVWVGTLEDVTDQYPDRRMVVGPRGGVITEHC